nr:MarR family transcriptional regulator [Heyndrickxia ginsengihumi]
MRFAAFFNVDGLKPSEVRMLMVIYKSSKETGISVSKISQHLQVTSSTVTQLINDLEKKGLVIREIDPNDRRMVRIELTDQGKEMMQKAEKAREQFFNGLVEFVGEEECKELIQQLEKVIQYIDNME